MLRNPKHDAALTIDDITAGPNFALTPASTCSSGTVLAPGKSCTIIVAFVPDIPGDIQGTLTIENSDGIDVAQLHGKGVTPKPKPSPTPSATPTPAPGQPVCDGVTDDAATLQAELNSGEDVEIPSVIGNCVFQSNVGCRISVPLVHSTTANSAIYGSAESNSCIAPLFNGGPAIIEANPLTEVAAVGPITAPSHLGSGASMCWNGAGDPCGPPTGSDPGDYSIDLKQFVDNTDLAVTGALNGLGPGQLTIEAEVYSAANGTLTYSASGLSGTIPSLIMQANTNSFTAAVDIGGIIKTLNISTWSNDAWHHVALVYDNHSGNGCSTASCLRTYVDGIQSATLDVVGTIVQPPYDVWLLGAEPYHFPSVESAGFLGWDGMIDYFHVYQAVLYPSGTSFSPPSAKPTPRTLDMLVLNFDLSPAIQGIGSSIGATGILQADYANGSNFGSCNGPNNDNKCASYGYIAVSTFLSGEIGYKHVIHDLTISNGGEAILGSNCIGLSTYNVNLQASHVPYKTYNNCYEQTLNNATISTFGEAGIETSHNSFIDGSEIVVNNGTAFEIAAEDQSSGQWYGLFTNPQLGHAIAAIYDSQDSLFSSLLVSGFDIDAENSAPTTAGAWLEGGVDVFEGGQFGCYNSTPAFQLTAGTAVSLYGTTTAGCGGGAQNLPLVDFLTTPTATDPDVIWMNALINGITSPYVTFPLSNQPQQVDFLN